MQLSFYPLPARSRNIYLYVTTHSSNVSGLCLEHAPFYSNVINGTYYMKKVMQSKGWCNYIISVDNSEKCSSQMYALLVLVFKDNISQRISWPYLLSNINTYIQRIVYIGCMTNADTWDKTLIRVSMVDTRKTLIIGYYKNKIISRAESLNCLAMPLPLPLPMSHSLTK